MVRNLTPETDSNLDSEARRFWRLLKSGVEVSVASSGRLPDKLLGIRDGFRRFFGEGLGWPVAISVQSRLVDDHGPLPMADRDILELARQRVDQVEHAAEHPMPFLLGCESGLTRIEVGTDSRHFVTTWAVVRALGQEAWGSSGALQLPQHLIDNLDVPGTTLEVPGTRRSGGMVSSLTQGQETRRSGASLATFHALSSLLYGSVD